MIDHADPEAVYARLISRGEGLLRAVDRVADQPALRDGPAITTIHSRLRSLSEELTALTGVDATATLPDAESPTPGELFVSGSELVGVLRAAAWWNDETASRLEAATTTPIGTAAYL